MARLLIMLAWLCSSQAAARAVGVSADLAVVVPAVVLLSSALVPLLEIGARLLPVAATVTSAWLLAALTWGEGRASALVASALALVLWLSREGGGQK
ncbi:hypothetical protein [Nonomuraea basaltis]|uniref:hypothetical protein n=1 Tax=Nonomuraea basaltis TaxID=2495887 RepID=UPI00110C5CC7|nr:hypothetical protein [Nonomuraea basaltis]TMR99476.1 hypothetical protein EJK15_06590 [Nonomuraea basaltis]